MQKIMVAGTAVALLVGAGYAETAQARCVWHGTTATCRHIARIHHHHYYAMHRHAYPVYGYGYPTYGYGYYGGYGMSGYGYGSSINSSEQHNQGTGN